MSTPATPSPGTPVSPENISERRIHTPPTANTHYVTEFQMGPAKGALADCFHAAARTLDAWCRRKSSAPAFARREESFGTDPNSPDAWAVHVRHHEGNSRSYRRWWYVDVAMQRIKTNYFLVRVTVSHSLDYDFMGWTPHPPDPAAPAFILDWLADPTLRLRSGEFPIVAMAPASKSVRSPRERVKAMMLPPSDASKLSQLIFDAARAMPVVLVNGELNAYTFPLVPDELQRRLVASCYVVWAPPASGWTSAWRDNFPSGFVCPPNGVRIYQVAASATQRYDSLRHRFFTDDEIRKNGGVDAFVNMIRDGLTRRLLVPRPKKIWGCDDVVSLRERSEFEQQRSKLTSKDEELTLYEREYPKLVEEKKLSDQLLEQVDGEREQLAMELASTKAYAEGLSVELTQLKETSQNSAPTVDQRALIRGLFFRKQSVLDCLHAINAIVPDATEILPSAFRSAEAAKKFELSETLCELLGKLATDFRDALVAGKSAQEAARTFGRDTYTAHESDNLSVEGRTARTFSYQGRGVLMEQHLKIGVKDSEARCLRVHFMWDSATKKVVIGHCGKHLPL